MASGASGDELAKNSQPWSKRGYGVVGKRHVMIIASDLPINHPESVEKRPAIELTEGVRTLLERQGVSRSEQTDDISIIKARYNLDRRKTVGGIERSTVEERLKKLEVIEKITKVLHESKEGAGVVIFYIGNGRKDKGDWCFEDGFITFKELAKIYMQSFHGKVMTVVSDCSYSGRWIYDCMKFLDSKGVLPCGHSAREKGILLKVYSSCLSHQIPRSFSFAVYGCKNNVNSGYQTFCVIECIRNQSKISDGQHSIGIDYTEIQCTGKSIDEACRLHTSATWSKWSQRERIYLTKGMNSGKPAWHYVMLNNDDQIILEYIEKTQGENAGVFTVDVSKYGKILKSGYGLEPPPEVKEWLTENYGLHSEDRF